MTRELRVHNRKLLRGASIVNAMPLGTYVKIKRCANVEALDNKKSALV